MSGEYVELLKNRSKVFLREAERLFQENEFDIACFNIEQAFQLYLKALIIRLTGENLRTHSIRSLLGYLIKKLKELGFEECSKKLADLVKEYRDVLEILEDVYSEARYGRFRFSKEITKTLIEVVKIFLDNLNWIENYVWKS